MWFFQSLQDLTGNTQRRFLGIDRSYIKTFLSIEQVKLRPQAPATHWDRADATPFAVTFHEDLSDGFLCRAQTFESHRPLVGVGDFDRAAFQ